jgi:hypothetical protein
VPSNTVESVRLSTDYDRLQVLRSQLGLSLSRPFSVSTRPTRLSCLISWARCCVLFPMSGQMRKTYWPSNGCGKSCELGWGVVPAVLWPHFRERTLSAYLHWTRDSNVTAARRILAPSERSSSYITKLGLHPESMGLCESQIEDKQCFDVAGTTGVDGKLRFLLGLHMSAPEQPRATRIKIQGNGVAKIYPESN